MDILSQLEDLQGELEGKVLDAFSDHLNRLAGFESKLLQNIPEPWVYLSFESGHLRATVNWSDASGDTAMTHNVEIQGLEADVTDINLPDAIYRVDGKRKECAAYLRKLADAIESTNA
jgi:hypothetical protein